MQIIIPAVVLTVTCIVEIAQFMLSRPAVKQPESLQTELSKTDAEMVEKSQEIVKTICGINVMKTFQTALNYERVEILRQLANETAKAYGLENSIEIDIYSKEIKDNTINFGYYDEAKKRVCLNMYMLTAECDWNDEVFELLVRKMLGTVFHEMRHAVQHRAVSTPGFWNIDEKRRKEWEWNFSPEHYIQPETDIRAYAEQPVEKDAVTFEEAVMKGVA